MEDYNKIIESLGIKYLKSNNVKVINPLTIVDFKDTENILILLKKGAIHFGKNKAVKYLL